MVVARARAVLGVPFRLHGRDGAGLDCVGLAAHALQLDVPSGYPLRGGEPDVVRVRLDAVRHPVEVPLAAGDLPMMLTWLWQLLHSSCTKRHCHTRLRLWGVR